MQGRVGLAISSLLKTEHRVVIHHRYIWSNDSDVGDHVMFLTCWLFFSFDLNDFTVYLDVLKGRFLISYLCSIEINEHRRVPLASGDNSFVVQADALWISRISTLSASPENERECYELRYTSYYWFITWPWARHLSILDLSFLIFKMRVILLA